MTLRDIYKKNQDLSLAEALGIVGTEDLLTDVIRQFCSSADDNISAIENSMMSRDYESYTIKVHALKSTARTIGAKKLSDTARLLETFGKKALENDTESKKEILRHTSSCIELYLRVSSAFSAMFEGPTEDTGDDMPPGFLEEFYSSAHAFAEDFDTDGIDSLMKKIGRYRIPDEHRPRFQRFKNAVESSDWDAMCELSGS